MPCSGAADQYLVVQNTNTRADLDPVAKNGPDNVTVLARDVVTGLLNFKGARLDGPPTVSAVWTTHARM